LKHKLDKDLVLKEQTLDNPDFCLLASKMCAAPMEQFYFDI